MAFSDGAICQKKPIDQYAWEVWRNITGIQQSPSGDWVVYCLEPMEGDQELILYSTATKLEKRIPRGEKAQIHFNDQYIAFLIKPQFDTIRQLKLKDVKKTQFPKDTLCVYWTSKDTMLKVPEVTSFQVAEKGDWMAYLSTKDLRPVPKKKRKKRDPQLETTGKTLVLLNPITHEEKNIHRVVSYQFDRDGKFISYVTSTKGEKDSLTLHIMQLQDQSITTLVEHQMAIEKTTFDRSGLQLVFLASTDTGKVKNFDLFYWKKGQHNAHTIVDSTTKGMPLHWTVSENMNPYFSRNGDRIFLGTNKIRTEEPKDTLLETEKVKLDIWHYQDKRIQPEQLSDLKTDQNKAFLAVFLTENRKFHQLEDEQVDNVILYDHGDAYYGLGIDSRPYSIERTWTSNWRADIYIVSVKGGTKTKIKEGLSYGFGSGPSLAPSGKYLLWFNNIDSSWISYDVISKKDLNLTKHLKVTFEEEVNGVPGTASRSDIYGWSLINEDEYLLVSDKLDIWALNPSHPDRTFCLTQHAGANDTLRFSLVRTEKDSTYIVLENSLLKGIDQNSFEESLYKINRTDNLYSPEKLFETPHKIQYVDKAEQSDKVLFSRKSFIDYPDLESTDIHFNQFTRVSDANPQQNNYNWGTVEPLTWYSFDSSLVRGLLYKPEDFDSNKTYPMIVYFYSLNSENIHDHYIPKPVLSYINFTEYVSNGYLIFVPDIIYGEPGHPGKDAYNCVVSGTQYLYRKYNWIDSTRLGLQGQSWGGYQTVQLITMTGIFKAAMAGAAVGNMFSAYGGIRWSSGLARTFQYEEGQSRIGATIWEHPELYIENSPVFHLDKVTTPLFLRHNDEDGAVPWYQSIEIYIGLRRLQRPVWLLNYNGDDHWNVKLPNRIDYNIRMRQFFDHYLKNAPMPLWMKEGRSAMDKETKDALELEK